MVSWYVTYFLNDFEIVPVALIITHITVVFTVCIRCISFVKSLYFKIFSASFFYYISISRDCYIYQHACSLFCISDYNVWLLVRDGSLCTCWFHSMVILPPWVTSTEFGTCSYRCFFFTRTPISLHMLLWICAHTPSCHFMYCSFANIGHAYIIWSTVSSNCWQSLHLLSVSVFSISLT